MDYFHTFPALDYNNIREHDIYETNDTRRRLPRSLLSTIKENLENHFKDACDIEFTIENGELYILGVRRLSRSPKANLRFTIDFFLDDIIDLNESIQRIHPDDLLEYIKPIILTKKKLTFISRGIPACADHDPRWL